MTSRLIAAMILFLTMSPVMADNYMLLRFHASWCGPCHTQDKVYDKADIDDRLKDRGIEDVPVDVDKRKDLVQLWEVETIPCTILVRVRGREQRAVKRWGGYRDRSFPIMSKQEYLWFINPRDPRPTPPPKPDKDQ